MWILISCESSIVFDLVFARDFNVIANLSQCTVSIWYIIWYIPEKNVATGSHIDGQRIRPKIEKQNLAIVNTYGHVY